MAPMVFQIWCFYRQNRPKTATVVEMRRLSKKSHIQVIRCKNAVGCFWQTNIQHNPVPNGWKNNEIYIKTIVLAWCYFFWFLGGQNKEPEIDMVEDYSSFLSQKRNTILMNSTPPDWQIEYLHITLWNHPMTVFILLRRVFIAPGFTGNKHCLTNRNMFRFFV